MGLFNFFSKKTDHLDNYLSSIQSQILDTDEFLIFKSLSEDYKNELNEFKKFIVIFIAGCLFDLKVKQHLKIDDFKANDPIHKKIFQTLYRQLIPFYKSYVQSDRIIIGLFNNDRFKDDKMLLLDIMARFGKWMRMQI